MVRATKLPPTSLKAPQKTNYPNKTRFIVVGWVLSQFSSWNFCIEVTSRLPWWAQSSAHRERKMETGLKELPWIDQEQNQGAL